MKKPFNRAFTLIEMLVVVIIIALLTATVVIAFNRGSYQTKQNDNARTKSINEIATAIEAFKADHSHYPFVNWYGGTEHAADKLGYSTCPIDRGISSHYIPTEVGTANFSPGTKIVFTTDNKPCDDLSIQLLGLAYLAKMPQDEGPITDPNLGWKLLNGSSRYLDEIPKDPLYELDVTSSNTDYTVTPGYKFRFFYNSYGDSEAEAFNTGDRFWLNAIVQNQKSGEKEGTTNLYYYEIGSMNWVRSPKTNFIP